MSNGKPWNWTRRRVLRTIPAALASSLLPYKLHFAAAQDKPSVAPFSRFDYDNDGWMDIFIVGGRRLEDTPPGSSNRLYRNNRDGTFTDVTEKAGLFDCGWACGVCVGDYNNDGFEDLFLTYYGQNRLYRNNG